MTSVFKTFISRRAPPTSDRGWAAFVQHAPDAMMLSTLDGRILSVNPAACTLLCGTEAEICAGGRDATVVDDEAWRRLLTERSVSGVARSVLTMKRRNGTSFLADTASTIFRNTDGSMRRTLVVRDVTESERARHALEIIADAGLRLPASLEVGTTLLYLTELVVPKVADVCVVDLIEPGGVQRVAFAHRDPKRIPLFEQVRCAPPRRDVFSGTDDVLRTGKPSCVFSLTDDWLRRATEDEEHYRMAKALGVRSFISVPLTARGKIIGSLALISDGGVPPFSPPDVPLVEAVGARAGIAIENAHRHAEAIESRRQRDSVLDVVAHDLRNPLNVINIAASICARSSPPEATKVIKDAVRRADSLLEDLLLAAKTAAGRLPLQFHDEDVASILHEVAAIHRPLAEAKAIELRVTPGTTVAVTLDRRRVVQMLSNLVANAIKFTPHGGRIDLSSSMAGGHVCLCVGDSGPGIAKEELAHVFDRYWQAEHVRSAGAGLGLAIARGIARAHDGDVAVESAPGRGARFTIDLPIAAKDGARSFEVLTAG